MLVVVSSGTGKHAEGWEHVSVSADGRCPTWDEMCWVKDLFWTEDECTMQLHPPKSDYVNCHPHCLHIMEAHRDDDPGAAGDVRGTEAMTTVDDMAKLIAEHLPSPYALDIVWRGAIFDLDQADADSAEQWRSLARAVMKKARECR